MARHIAPGLQRAEREGFACERWKDFDADAWHEVIREAKAPCHRLIAACEEEDFVFVMDADFGCGATLKFFLLV